MYSGKTQHEAKRKDYPDHYEEISVRIAAIPFHFPFPFFLPLQAILDLLYPSVFEINVVLPVHKPFVFLIRDGEAVLLLLFREILYFIAVLEQFYVFHTSEPPPELGVMVYNAVEITVDEYDDSVQVTVTNPMCLTL